MSTRSGRRIHLSLHENTIKSEVEIPKSERKTRSKHTKENLEESQPIPKAKKRNYVAYPGDILTGVDAVDGKDEGRATRALRKNALKERNCGSPTEVVGPPSDNKPATDLTRSVRSTRRTRKFPENIEDAPESVPLVPQDEEQLSKPKKDKKKKKKAEKEELAEEDLSKQQKVEIEVMAVPKTKSKKKKGQRSTSIVVEDIVPEAPSTLNKSNMSVDSFHSAAASPQNTDNEADEVQKAKVLHKVVEVRKTRSSGKPEILSNNEETEKQQRRRKSTRKMAMDVSEDVAEKGEEGVSRNSNSHDTKDEENIFDVEQNKNTSTRKSKSSTFDKTITPRKVNTTFDKETNNKNKISNVSLTADEAVEPAEEYVNTTFDQDVDIESVKSKRKSAINALTHITFDNKPTPKKSNKKKSITNDLFEMDVEAKVPEDKKSLFDGTYSYISADNSSPLKHSGENMYTKVDNHLAIESVKGKRKSAINAASQMSQNNKLTPRKSIKRKSIDMDTSENDIEAKVPKNKKSIFDTTYITAENSSPITKKMIKKSVVNLNFEELEPSSELEIETKKNETYDLTSSPFKSAYEVSSPMRIDDVKRKSLINTTVENDDTHHVTENCKSTESKITTSEIEPTQETVDKINKRKSSVCISSKADSSNNSTFDIDQDKKLDATFEKHSKSSIMTSDSSMITLDKSNVSRISITSDESKNEENILNATPMLIESSLDESAINTTQTKVTTPVKNNTTVSAITPLKREGTFTKDETEVISSPNTEQTKVATPDKNDTTLSPITPMKREGTFTKDETEVVSSPKPRVSRTPTKRMSMPSPGFTPYHINKSSSKERSSEHHKTMMNITRSIEKRHSSMLEPPRTTKVMFCSPVNNTAVVNQIKKKVIKSNLKGSNKSFVFDESAIVESRPGTRKRSYTQSDADEARVKRKRLTTDLQHSVNRLSRPRTSSASAKLTEPTTPSKKSESKISRTKLPNFAALHQKSFDKMESLGQCQERKAKRARQLLTPNGAVAMLDRISPKEKTTDQEKPPQKSKETSENQNEPGKAKEASKPDTPIKSLPTFKSLNPGYTRFGFKLNLDVNPFSIPSKPATKAGNTKPKDNKPNGVRRQATLPSLAGATSVRREVAKQTVMREKSFTDRRNEKRTENRTVIKGVRTNRRFELQMKMRDI